MAVRAEGGAAEQPHVLTSHAWIRWGQRAPKGARTVTAGLRALREAVDLGERQDGRGQILHGWRWQHLVFVQRAASDGVVITVHWLRWWERLAPVAARRSS